MKRKIIPYNPKLKQIARNLRNHSTRSEIILWHYLKGKQRHGFDFHRQKPIDNYIVDFFCHELMLVIELDGSGHWKDTIINKDAKKTIRLNELGIQVLRFEDEMVFDDIDYVIRKIDKYIEAYIRTHPLPPLERGC
jgi:very-short-patch-repair endonuclease